MSSVTATRAEGRASSLQRRTMVVLILSQIVGTVGVGVAPSLGVLLAGEVIDNEAWAGLARTSSTLGAALLGLPLGSAAARFGRRFALSVGWWIAALGAGLLVWAAQLSLVIPLFIGLLLIGSGSAASLQTRFAATDQAEPSHKGRALATVVWVGTLGSVLGPNLGVPGELVSAGTGLTVYASAFLITACCLAAAGTVVFVFLRPDPLQALLGGHGEARKTGRPKGRLARVVTELRQNPQARYATLAILTAQVVMVAVMTMTPVHIEHQGGTITVVGITISLHIAGMYALSPVVGALADRFGHQLTIGAGITILFASLLIGAVASESTGGIIAALILLGVGWSFVNVAGSALFSASIAPESRASAQGGIDSLSNLLGATAAVAAGPLLVVSNFATLAAISMVLLVPLTFITLLPRFRA